MLISKNYLGYVKFLINFPYTVQNEILNNRQKTKYSISCSEIMENKRKYLSDNKTIVIFNGWYQINFITHPSC